MLLTVLLTAAMSILQRSFYFGFRIVSAFFLYQENALRSCLFKALYINIRLFLLVSALMISSLGVCAVPHAAPTALYCRAGLTSDL